MSTDQSIHAQETEVPIQLYQLIDDFTNAVSKDPHVANILHEGLSVFVQLRDTFFASVFLMNADTFDFEHSLTLPRSMSTEAERVYALLVENGRIGAALSGGQIVSFHHDGVDEPHYFVAPMIGMRGVIGLLIVSSDLSPREIPNANVKCYTYFVQMFAKSLENAEVLERNAKLEDMLQQRIATRTMQLVETKKELLNQMEELRVNLATAIPHEIRTPINTILGSSAFMRDHLADIDCEDAHEMLQDIYSSAQRLQRLFENYQNYSRLSITATQADEIAKIRAARSTSVKLFIESIARYRVDAAGRTQDLRASVDEATLHIPEDLLRTVLNELLDNAIKYSEPGQDIVVRGRKRGEQYELTVHDHGRGMPADRIQAIQAYMQFDRQTHEQQGMGLGLAIIQRICDITEAQLLVSSGSNVQGTLVQCTLRCESEIEPATEE